MPLVGNKQIRSIWLALCTAGKKNFGNSFFELERTETVRLIPLTLGTDSFFSIGFLFPIDLQGQ